jgi:methyltransferase (TIGR00027 family)
LSSYLGTPDQARRILSGAVGIRTKFLDDNVITAVCGPQATIKQVVLLGIGGDMRHYRLEQIRNATDVHVFELDLEPVMRMRKEIVPLVDHDAPKCQIHSVSADVSDETWTQKLQESGFRCDQPTIWVLEGLLMYLSESQVGTLLGSIASQSADGSRICGDVMSTGMLESPMAKPTLDVWAKYSARPVSSMEVPEYTFAQHGMKIRAWQPGENKRVDFGRVSKQLKTYMLEMVPRFKEKNDSVPRNYYFEGQVHGDRLDQATLDAHVSAVKAEYLDRITQITQKNSDIAQKHAPSASLIKDLDHGLGQTAQYIAAGRAYELRLPQDERLYTDLYAPKFTGVYGEAMFEAVCKVVIPALEVTESKRIIGNMTSVRTAFYDEQLLKSVNDDGIEQVVICACGGDSRSRRLAIGPDVHVFEIDLPEVIQYRQQVFAAVEAENKDARQSQCSIHEVAADLSKDSWMQQLQDASFDPNKPTQWCVEGLLFYLSLSDVEILLQRIGSLSASNSRIAMDVMNSAYFTSPSNKPFLDIWNLWAASFSTPMDFPEEILGTCGFTVDINVRDYGDDGANFGRIADSIRSYYKSAPRGDTKDVPRAFLVTAHKK